MKRKENYKSTFSDSEISQKFSDILSIEILSKEHAFSIINAISNRWKFHKYKPKDIIFVSDPSNYGICNEYIDLDGSKYTTIELSIPNGNSVGTLLHEFAHSIVFHKHNNTIDEHDYNFNKYMDMLVTEFDIIADLYLNR